ncbi:MAG TPA: O-antigen ligase family protein [Acidimicrobiales bacterium]|nr:O-antigen ligase family protein [Acidimicrobiales bacterium]
MHGLEPVSVDLVVTLGVAIIVLALLAYALADVTQAPVLAAGLLGFAGATYLAVFTSPAWLVSIGLAMTMFSGNSSEIGLPISPDRLFIAAGLASLAFSLPGAVRERAIVWRPLHAVLAATAAIGIVSAVAVGTIATTEGFFALLDRLGLVPFIVFALAPLIYGRPKDRNALLVVLVGTGLYLGVTAVFEGTHNGAFVWPRYIDDSSYGTHYGRARGPFAQPSAMGMALYGCAVGSAVAAYTWETMRSRRFAGAVALLCLVGTIFTLTRSNWLATGVATVLAALTNERTRRVLLPIGMAGFVVLVAALTFIPGFADRVSERQSDVKPLWDRYNTNHAAIEMVRERPLTGVGWQSFEAKAADYMHVADTYPLTGLDIPVHNVPLSHAAELGIIGAGVWLVGLALAIGAAILRPGPEDLEPWRLGMVALFLHWVVVASFVPLGYAFPNLLLWLWAGVCAIAHTSRKLTAAELAAQ